MDIKKALSWRKDYYYDFQEGMRVCQFFERELIHIDGEHAGKPFILQRWQRRYLHRLFGWKNRSDGTRKHRRTLLFIPKKNGKSALESGAALYLLIADKEPGSNVVSAAGETDQAELVFKFAKENVLRNPKLKKLITKVFRRSMSVHSTASSYKVLSSNAKTKHGPNLHGILIDELHVLPNRELVDTLVAGAISRKQPLVMYTTTAGHDKNTICGEIYDYACQVRDGIIDDPTFLPAIFEAGKDDDWRDRKTWYKANPSLGITISESALAAACKLAQDLPSEENKFKRLHLNIWTQQDIRWIPMEKWDLCGEKFMNPLRIEVEFNESQLDNMPCFGGLDLASRIDIAALALIFPLNDSLFYALFRYWVPENTALERENKGHAPYHTWIKQGFLTGTPGDDIDYAFIREEIKQRSKQYKIKEIGFDPWNANQLTKEINDQDGTVMVPMRQGYGTLNAPCKEFEGFLAARKFRHGNHPITKWMASNVQISTDAKGNICPQRPQNRNLKIDGIAAMIMGFGRLIVSEGHKKSIYDVRGVRRL